MPTTPFPLMLQLMTSQNLLVNPTFKTGLEGWKIDEASVAAGVKIEPAIVDGQPAVRLLVPEGVETMPCYLSQELAVHPGQVLSAQGEVLRTRIKDGAGACLELVYYNAAGECLSALPEDYAVIDGHWTRLYTPLHHTIVVPRDCAHVSLRLAFNGHGEACFRNLSVVRLTEKPQPELTGPVTLNVTSQVACPSLFGFGAEDDGWFHLDVNKEKGVTEEDVALCEKRIEWIKPAWIRSFIAVIEWCPSLDRKTFTFESPDMQSHYRALDLYQRLGTRVAIAGADWKADGFYDDATEVARAIGELFEYLIKKKGYTCIHYWTISNEPDSDFSRRRAYRFDHFSKIHRLVKEEFARRGLDIQIIGSDDADARAFYEACAADPEYYKLTDIFCSHTYPRACCLPAVPEFFDSRLRPLEAQEAHGPKKPFIVGEFGFLGPWFTSHDNPLMLTYPYALWATAFAIEGLNRGTAGFSIWTMHEVYYPFGHKMQFGLWDFKDNGWKPRPVYYAWANFCRLTKTGDQVRRCESSHPERLSGSLVGNTLFWVNRGQEPVEVEVHGFVPREVRIQTEATLYGDRECGELLNVKDGRFTAPAQSFGYAIGFLTMLRI